jgi:hypothetical protein
MENRSKTVETLSKVLFYAMVAVLFVWTFSLNMAFVGRILPDKPLAVYFSIVLFDGGTLGWMFIFLNNARGMLQRMTSFIMTLISLIGVGILSFAELFIGGQEFVQGEILTNLGTVALWVIGIWTFINISAVVMYHLFDQNIQTEMAINQAKGSIRDAALKIVKKQAPQVAKQLAPQMAAEVVRDIVKDSVGEDALNSGQVKITTRRRRKKQTDEDNWGA